MKRHGQHGQVHYHITPPHSYGGGLDDGPTGRNQRLGQGPRQIQHPESLQLLPGGRRQYYHQHLTPAGSNDTHNGSTMGYLFTPATDSQQIGDQR